MSALSVSVMSRASPEGIGKNRRQLESTKPGAEDDHARLHCFLPICLSASPSYRTTAVGAPGCGTIRIYGFGDFQPFGYAFLASSSDTEPAMMTSSPCFQFTGVATFAWP